MPNDFEVQPGLTFGDWLHRQIHEVCLVETHGWAAERVTRVAERLQRDRPGAERLRVEVPWLDAINAFAAPGRWLYVTRRLLERCADDEMTAFVIAHEIAHHDLGHVSLFSGGAGSIVRLTGVRLMAAPFGALEKRLYGPERECQADRHGLSLCIEAGYDPARCLRFLDVMEEIALDFGDLGAVYGPDPSDDELMEGANWRTRARIWGYQRVRGYLPIRDRRAALVRWLERQDGTHHAPVAA